MIIIKRAAAVSAVAAIGQRGSVLSYKKSVAVLKDSRLNWLYIFIMYRLIYIAY